MCFGPSAAEKQAAAESRAAAEEAKQQAIQERAQQKQESLGAAIDMRSLNAAKRGGTGRRSLFTSPAAGAGFVSRFDR